MTQKKILSLQQVLYRVRNGELENIKPKVSPNCNFYRITEKLISKFNFQIVVLHVGTHNISHSAQEVCEAILEIVKEIRARHPETYLVVPSLLPRGQFPNPLREKNEKVNVLLKEKCAALKKFQIVEIDKGIVQQDGTISHHDLYDYLNLTNAGSKKVFEPVWDLLNQILDEILNENEPEPTTLTPSE